MRTKLIAANWKMNPAPQGFSDDNSPYRKHSKIDVVVLPTFLDLAVCCEIGLATGAQYGRPESSGAFTGDISMHMIKETGCQYVLCGHSERRQHHHETDEDIAKQVTAALDNGLIPIVCIGETLNERESDQQKEIVEAQLKALPSDGNFVIAYEPVWAIGTGKTAAPDQAEEMHAFIRSLLPAETRDIQRILYGGSMKGDNAEELLRQPNIDGGLVGGASLKPAEFASIVEIAATL